MVSALAIPILALFNGAACNSWWSRLVFTINPRYHALPLEKRALKWLILNLC